MNSQTHELIARALVDVLRGLGCAVPASVVLRAFDHPGDVDELARASSAPDRVRDIKIKLPGCSQSYGVDGKNLSSLTHFCNPAGRGYSWYNDSSLPWGSAELLHLVDAPLSWDPAPDGERSPGIGPHPEEVALAVGEHMLGSHVFASAETMLRYYVREARDAWRANDLSRWRACVGFALHYLADLHIPHHAWGVLRYGHQPFEDAIEAEWRRHVGMLAMAEPGLLAEEVHKRYHDRSDLDDILANLPSWGAARFLDTPRTLQGVDLSLDVLAAGLALAPLLVA
jgi:hypothetical protein